MLYDFAITIIVGVIQSIGEIPGCLATCFSEKKKKNIIPLTD